MNEAVYISGLGSGANLFFLDKGVAELMAGVIDQVDPLIRHVRAECASRDQVTPGEDFFRQVLGPPEGMGGTGVGQPAICMLCNPRQRLA